MYSNFEDLTTMYLKGDNKLSREIDAARKIATPTRKLIVTNESIAKQASHTKILRGQYAKIVSKLLPEDVKADEYLKDSLVHGLIMEKKVVTIGESNEKDCIVSEGYYDRQNLIY